MFLGGYYVYGYMTCVRWGNAAPPVRGRTPRMCLLLLRVGCMGEQLRGGGNITEREELFLPILG